MIEARIPPQSIDWELVGIWLTLVVGSLVVLWLAGAALYWGWVIYA